MADRWLLIETFGGDGRAEPTVIGVGSTAKRMASLVSVLGRGRDLDDIRGLLARVAGGGQSIRTTSSSGRRHVVAAIEYAVRHPERLTRLLF